MEDKMKKELADQIWFTRIARTKAERRLINKEKFIEFINIYYSLLAIICSILSYIHCDSKMSLFTIIITICLMVSIMYLNGQNYLQQAQDYRKNYTRLQLLEMKVKNLDIPIENLQEEYYKLLKSSSNQIEYDYLVAIKNSSDEYRKSKGWKKKQFQWFWEVLWRAIVKLLVLIAPIAILVLCEVFA